MELQHEVDLYERGSKKEMYVTRSEEKPNGMLILITPEMGGKIVLRYVHAFLSILTPHLQTSITYQRH